jgi:hypothetical protein
MTNEHALVVIGCYVPLVNSVANKAWQTLRSAVLAQQTNNTLRDAIALLEECLRFNFLEQCNSITNCNCLGHRIQRFVDAQQHP